MHESMSVPGRIALTTVVAEDAPKAHLIAMEKVKSTYGDLVWSPRLVTDIDLAEIQKAVGPAINVVAAPNVQVDIDKNWLLKTIIDNKDTELFEQAKKYLASHEIQFISDKITS